MTDNRSYLSADLALAEVATGTVTTLAHGYRPVQYSVAPGGQFVVFTSSRPPMLSPNSTRATFPYDLVIVPLGVGASKQPRTIAAGIAIPNSPRSAVWAPDGATLLYTVTDSGGRGQYFAARADDWRPRRVGTIGIVAPGAKPRSSAGRGLWWHASGRQFYVLEAGGVVTVSMPDGIIRSVVHAPKGYETVTLAGRQGRGTAWSDSSGSLRVVFSHDATKRMGFARIDPGTGAWRVMREEDRFYGNHAFLPLDVANDGHVVFRAEDAQHPQDLWSATPDFSMVRRITHTAPRLEGIEYGATRLVEWTTAAGAPRRGTLVLPANYRPEMRYPLVVYPYPSDRRSNDVNVFGVTGTGVENMQLLATRGFAVLAPDVPPIQTADQMRELAAIILPGIDRVIAFGIADSTRLGVIGHSWGGYTVLALLVQTQRFRAAVMRGGYGDLVAGYGHLRSSGWAHGLLVGEMQLGGTVWEQRERYIKNSPIYFLDRVRTPLLIIHGESETTSPIFLADQVFASLQRLGKKVEYARYEGEDHSEALWAYTNQRDYLARMIRWFGTHLQSAGGTRNSAAPRTQ